MELVCVHHRHCFLARSPLSFSSPPQPLSVLGRQPWLAGFTFDTFWTIKARTQMDDVIHLMASPKGEKNKITHQPLTPLPFALIACVMVFAFINSTKSKPTTAAATCFPQPRFAVRGGKACRAKQLCFANLFWLCHIPTTPPLLFFFLLLLLFCSLQTNQQKHNAFPAQRQARCCCRPGPARSPQVCQG